VHLHVGMLRCGTCCQAVPAPQHSTMSTTYSFSCPPHHDPPREASGGSTWGSLATTIWTPNPIVAGRIIFSS
jgi:hypothetical protein